MQVEAAGASTPSRLRTTSARDEDSPDGTNEEGASGQAEADDAQSPSLDFDEADADEAEQVAELCHALVSCLKLETMACQSPSSSGCPGQGQPTWMAVTGTWSASEPCDTANGDISEHMWVTKQRP